MEITAEQMMLYFDNATDEELIASAAYIQETRRHRAQMAARRTRSKLTTGTRVRFTGGKPKYLTGELGEVIELRGNKVLIQLDRPQGKFINGQVLAPLTLIEVV
jgi:hypothetical protein